MEDWERVEGNLAKVTRYLFNTHVPDHFSSSDYRRAIGMCINRIGSLSYGLPIFGSRNN